MGYLTGRGGGTFGGGWITNDRLVEYALNDLRNQAAKLGANYVQHDPPQMGSGDGTTTTVTITGTAYLCRAGERFQVAKEEGASTGTTSGEPPKSQREAPVGAGGFSFGDGVQSVAAACEQAGHKWKARDEQWYDCSGPVKPIGVPAAVLARFCSGTLCEIRLQVEAAGDVAAQQQLYSSLKEKLSEKYGKPRSEKTPAAECEGTNAASCYTEGRARSEAIWAWSDGARVMIALEKSGVSDHPVALRLYYAKGGPALKSEGL